MMFSDRPQTPAQWAALADMLATHPDFRLLRRLVPTNGYGDAVGRPVLKGIVVDTETTGVNYGIDQVIEIGMVAFEFCPVTGAVFRVLDQFNALEDPGMSIPPAATEVNGITDAMVAGQTFDDAAVGAFVAGSAMVIAHNASFDRPFLEKRLPVFAQVPWGCSLQQVDWAAEGCQARSLDYIASKLGFFFSGHRAQADCFALLEAIQQPLPRSGTPALRQILQRARLSDYRVWARGARFDTKELLKEHGYRWHADEKCWYHDIEEVQLEAEKIWLKRTVFGNRSAVIEMERCTPMTRFSHRTGTRSNVSL